MSHAIQRKNILSFISALLIVGTNAVHSQDDVYGPDNYESLIIRAETKAPEDGRKVLETGRTMTLTNKEILPGSCWDYINAVFDRAGYAWGKRQYVFTSVKAGPFADLGKVKSGDWLYYVNHSYGDIEHSAIFVEWINYENKLALMLSYGGESRHEPARYLSYELSNVYTIIRADSHVGSEKSVANTGSGKLLSSGSNMSSGGSLEKKTSTTATGTSISNSSSVVSESISGIKVESLKFGSKIDKMEVIGESTSFSVTSDKVYCWMRISGGQGKTVTVKWFCNSAVIGETVLDIRSNPMRTYAYRTVTGKKGNWKVEIVDGSGALIHSADFTVN